MKKLVQTLLIISFVNIFALPVHYIFAQENQEHNPHVKYAAINVSVLNLRADKTTKSRIVTTLQEGDVVEILKYNSTLQTINGWQHTWYKVKYKNKTGWLFGAYITFFFEKPDSGKVKFTKQVFPHKQWRINSDLIKNLPLNKKTLFLDGFSKIKAYRSIPRKNRMPNFILREKIFLNYIKLYPPKEYGAPTWFAINHKKHGKVYINAQNVHTVRDIIETNDRKYLLTSTYPVMEGDTFKVRIIISDKKNKILYATTPFMEPGTHVSVKWYNKYKKGKKLQLFFIADGIGCSNPLCKGLSTTDLYKAEIENDTVKKIIKRGAKNSYAIQ